MTHQGRLVAGFAILAALAVGSLILWHSASNNEVAPPIFHATQGEGEAAAVPSVASLMADPSSLKAAAKACFDGTGIDVVTLCDRVHSAEAGLLAHKYRQGPAR